MYFVEALNYLAIGNPVSQTLISAAAAVINSTGGSTKQPPSVKAVITPELSTPIPLWQLAGRHYNFVRMAGLSGVSAVIISVYGKHIIATSIANNKNQMEAKAIFETANRYHFLHTFALMAAPLARKPALTGSLMAIGTILFSGSMYYRALTGNKTNIHVGTCGGFCLIAAWITLIF